ncbi:TPA: hypothetical protein OWR10_002172 [Staphylococcus aureus]|nr:ftsk/spoiiie family protein [Staphylococcus aureus]HCV8000620.1 hypothetical protein [Staphylococcus aureus]HCY8506503.1 hypothetical protein [Staphylococcus aureus]HCZ0952059.1 hypothetical protein [Staphylococcus aureus]HDD2388207.1 hypothetical protein [Staphylococcus aureus]
MAMNEIALFKGVRIQPYQKYIDFMFAGVLAFIFWYIVYTFCLLIINQLIKNWIYGRCLHILNRIYCIY